MAPEIEPLLEVDGGRLVGGLVYPHGLLPGDVYEVFVISGSSCN